MGKYFEVQIPFRGRIPVINRYGPISRILLNEEQLKSIVNDHGIPVADPDTGNPLDMDIISIAPTIEIPTSYPRMVPTKDKMEIPRPVVNLSVAPFLQNIDETSKSDEDTDEDAELENEEENLPEFDHTKITNYSKLNSKKRKQVRRRYTELMTNNETGEDVYKLLNEFVVSISK